MDAPRPAALESDHKPLTGWKEISNYLGKSPRHVQRLAKLSCFPVHHRKFRRGPSVYAYRQEIDDWIRNGGLDTARLEMAGLATPAETAVRPGWILVTGAFAILALLAIAGSYRAPQPAVARLDGDTLRVFDERGSELWNHAFAFQLHASSYALRSEPWEFPGLIQLADLDNDGSREVLVVVTTVGRPAENRLYCFKANGGTPRYSVLPVSVSFGGVQYLGPFTVRYLHIAKNPDKTSTPWIVASHLDLFPTVIQKLDSNCNVRARYWTNGHVQMIKDVAFRGHRYLAVGGTSNDTGDALLALVDYDNPDGRTPALNRRYLCTSCDDIDPSALVLFPGSELTGMFSRRPYVVATTVEGGGVLRVTVNHGPDTTTNGREASFATAYYLFDAEMRRVRATVGDDYGRIHTALERAGGLFHRFGSDIGPLSAVRRWNAGSFRMMSSF